jgi:hypothetical protein
MSSREKMKNIRARQRELGICRSGGGKGYVPYFDLVRKLKSRKGSGLSKAS